MLTIWGRLNSHNVKKVAWFAEELGLSFVRHDVGGQFGMSDAYLAMNPNALIPTIDDDGFILWESNAILRYLAARHGGVRWWPDEPQLRALGDRWMEWQTGFALAQLNAAFMYLEGDGIPKELDAAAFWFHEAALAGSPIAQYNLGVMYEGGLGIGKDLPRALGWYALAARSGNQHAMDRLAVLVPAPPGPKPPSPADKPLAKVAPEPPPAIFEMRGSELQ